MTLSVMPSQSYLSFSIIISGIPCIPVVTDRNSKPKFPPSMLDIRRNTSGSKRELSLTLWWQIMSRSMLKLLALMTTKATMSLTCCITIQLTSSLKFIPLIRMEQMRLILPSYTCSDISSRHDTKIYTIKSVHLSMDSSTPASTVIYSSSPSGKSATTSSSR